MSSVVDKMVRAIAENLISKIPQSCIIEKGAGYARIKLGNDVIVTMRTVADKIKIRFDMPDIKGSIGNNPNFRKAAGAVNMAIDDAARETFDISFETH